MGTHSFGGKILFEVFQFLGMENIAYNQPRSLPYPFREYFGVESQYGSGYEAKIRREDIFDYYPGDQLLYVNPDKLFDIVFHEDFPLPEKDEEDIDDWGTY